MRDYIDVSAALDQYAVAELLELARQVDPALDADDVRAAGRYLDRVPDRRFARYGLGPRPGGRGPPPDGRLAPVTAGGRPGDVSGELPPTGPTRMPCSARFGAGWPTCYARVAGDAVGVK